MSTVHTNSAGRQGGRYIFGALYQPIHAETGKNRELLLVKQITKSSARLNQRRLARTGSGMQDHYAV